MNDSPRQPLEPGPEVYELYGFVMHAVQIWEEHLAGAWLWALLPKTDVDREAEGKAAEKAVRRVAHAFTKLTPQQARNDLDAELSEAVLQRITELLPVRNLLAHRFLAQRSAGEGTFAGGTLRELRQFAEGFKTSLDELHGHLEATPEYGGPVRPHWPALAGAIISTLESGEPLDYRVALRDARKGSGLDPWRPEDRGRE